MPSVITLLPEWRRSRRHWSCPVAAIPPDHETRIVRSSSLALAPGLRGQARVLGAVCAVGGDHYVNAPGGRDLYSGDAFRQAGVRLSFLAPYEGRFMHLLPALMTVSADEIRDDLVQTTRLLPA